MAELFNEESESVKKVQENGFYLTQITEQTEEMCLVAVQQNGFALQYVQKQTPDICLAAIAYEKQGSNLEASHRYLLEYNHAHKEDDGVLKHDVAEFVFQYVREPTPDICLAAVKEYGEVLQFIPEQTEEICLVAVQPHGCALQYVQEQTEEMCLAAVQQDGFALQYVQEQTPEICSAAVEQYADALRFVQEQTEEMCLAAVQKDGYVLQFVKEQTSEICSAAVENYADAVKYIKEQPEPSKPTVDPRKEAMDASFRNLISQAKKNEKSEKETTNIEAFKTLIKDSVVSHLNAKTAPWLNSHDGNVEKSFFPPNNYTPSGVTAIWLKLQEQQLATNDPRWYARSDIFKTNNTENKIFIKPNEKGTVMSFKDGETVRYNYYFNASQLTGVPPYIPQYEKSEQKPSLYHPQKVNNTFHPKETLRADLTNWFNSLETHTPFSPHGINRVQEVSKFLENSKGGTFFFVAKDASDTSQKMLQANKDKVITLTKNQGVELG